MQHRPKAWDWQTSLHTCTEGNIITVDEIVGLLNHKGQKQTYRSIRQIFNETDLTKSSIVLAGSVFCVPTCLLSMIAGYFCVYISRGSVATQFTYGGIFSNHFIANCPQNVTVKEFWKSVNIWRRYRQSQSGTFFWDSVELVCFIFWSSL